MYEPYIGIIGFVLWAAGILLAFRPGYENEDLRVFSWRLFWPFATFATAFVLLLARVSRGTGVSFGEYIFLVIVGISLAVTGLVWSAATFFTNLGLDNKNE